MVDNDYYGWLIIKMENPVRSLSEWMIRMVNHEIRLEWMIYRGTRIYGNTQMGIQWENGES